MLHMMKVEGSGITWLSYAAPYREKYRVDRALEYRGHSSAVPGASIGQGGLKGTLQSSVLSFRVAIHISVIPDLFDENRSVFPQITNGSWLLPPSLIGGGSGSGGPNVSLSLSYTDS